MVGVAFRYLEPPSLAHPTPFYLRVCALGRSPQLSKKSTSIPTRAVTSVKWKTMAPAGVPAVHEQPSELPN